MTNELNHYSWKDLDSDIINLQTQIEAENWEPTMVVGIVRGGCIPGIMLSHALNIPFEALQWSKRDFSSQSFGHYIDHILKKALRHKENILIVDDILDSGDTISDLKYYASKMASAKLYHQFIKFAVLIENIDSEITVDFTARKFSREADDRWIVFPWES